MGLKIEMKIKKLRDGATTPAKGSADAAGYDLYACIDSECTIQPNETMTIGTGVAAEIPEECFGAIFARSGLATHNGIRPANCVGVVDSDYRGEVMVALHNDSSEPYTFCSGERIAQLVVIPFMSVDIVEAEVLSDTQRGKGGFGSTGSTTINSSADEYEQLSLFAE